MAPTFFSCRLGRFDGRRHLTAAISDGVSATA